MTTIFERNPQLQKPGGRLAWAESFAPVLEELRAGLRVRQPARLAQLAGISWQPESSCLFLRHFDQSYRISWPDLTAFPGEDAQPCSANLQGTFLYYLNQADGSPPTEEWISFGELPDGWLYQKAFQGYTGDLLTQRFANQITPFRQAAAAASGHPIEIGDAGYRYLGLPRIPLALVYWLGDEEFPAQANVLFDRVASHYLPTDGLAGLGSHLIQHILRQMAATSGETTDGRP